MSPAEFDFHERLAMSDGVAAGASVGDILLANIPGAVRVVRATRSEDRSGVDWWVEREGTTSLGVDCKVRERDWRADHPKEDDLALETFSVIEKEIVGWTRDRSKQTDYVLWLWKDTGRWCLIPFAMLCAVFETYWQDWLWTYRAENQTTRRPDGTSYKSQCVFVPRKLVWRTIYERFGGSGVST